jgi:hypothetical protein
MRAHGVAAALALIAASYQTALPRNLEALPFAPRQYVCYLAPAPLAIDGTPGEAAWAAAPWTEAFVDIEGDARMKPRLRTRAKMLWDATFFYVAVEMEEPDLWATLTERDSVVFNDHDIEVFIDPDGDTHTYAELEMNALGTVWDLMLVKPYRDGGPALSAWDVAGLRTAVALRGTLNKPGDRDEGWTVEMAIPWRVLRETAPGKRPPRPGEQWRVNFSRVEWLVDVRDGRYAKRSDPATGRALASDNWAWSPQGAIDMHVPERWGFVQFSDLAAGSGTEAFAEDPNERVKWALRRLYYRQRQSRAASGRYATTLCALEGPAVKVDGLDFAPDLQATANTYQISAKGFGGAVVHLQHDGRVWLDIFQGRRRDD